MNHTDHFLVHYQFRQLVQSHVYYRLYIIAIVSCTNFGAIITEWLSPHGGYQLFWII